MIIYAQFGGVDLVIYLIITLDYNHKIRYVCRLCFCRTSHSLHNGDVKRLPLSQRRICRHLQATRSPSVKIKLTRLPL